MARSSKKNNNVYNFDDLHEYFEQNQPPRRKHKGSTGLKLSLVEPKTETQAEVFDCYDAGANLVLHGVAGTGKTFCALYLALDDILNYNDTHYKSIKIVRSVVPTRDMGFLPGNLKEKIKVYEQPYQAICSELFGRGDAYDVLKTKNLIEFVSTSFVRGTTFNDSIVIVDEVNNMTFHEIDSVVTRMGQNCKMIFCGDFRQSDLTGRETSGILTFIKIAKAMSNIELIEFGEQDIVRSGLVKEYIITRDRMQLSEAV